MPTYTYECEACGGHFEAFQSITAEPLTQCQKCNAEGGVHRLITGGAGFLFKGSGFYTTDYRSSEYQAAAKKEESAGSSDSKPAKKTDSEKASAKADKSEAKSTD